MKFTLIAATGLLFVASANAQLLPPPPPVGGVAFGQQYGFGFKFGNGGFRVGGFAGGTYSAIAPAWIPPPVVPVVPVYGWGWLPPPVVVAAPPVVVVQEPAMGFAIRPEPRGMSGGFDSAERRRLHEEIQKLKDEVAEIKQREEAAQARARVNAAIERGDLLVIRPNKEGVMPRIPERPVEVKPITKPAALPKDPKELAALRLNAAHVAFVEEQPGRAADHLLAVISLMPEEAVPYFLLAQVQLARGEYAEAVANIREGMKREPNWPAMKFRLKELYADKPARYDADFAELRAVMMKNPSDPLLMFLVGYQHWFLGDREAAVKLFKKAKPLVKEKDATLIERFLTEADPKS